MSPTSNSDLVISRARRLRKDMTEGEKRLWSELKHFRALYGVHFRKQAPIDPYIVDFVAHEQRLIIEVDGEHHFTPERQRSDTRRTAFLCERGYSVLRFTTGDLATSFDGCIEEILLALGHPAIASPMDSDQ